MKGKNTLQNLSSFYQSKFSHIYIEKNALNHKNTKEILCKLKNSNIIIIDNYKEVFNRPRQKFHIQNNSQKLIIAKKKKNFYYTGSPNCENFGENKFYYTSFAFNCLYNCEYCYLQGMYTSSNIVIFVNLEDYFKVLDKINDNIYLCLSYDSDILGLEPLTGLTNQFIEYLYNKKNILAEIKTKSANFSSVENNMINNNIIFAWSLLPDEIIQKVEKNTPSLSHRIKNIKMAVNKGLQIRISIEPIILIKNFEQIYSNFIEYIFEEIPNKNIRDINIGTLRYSKDHYKNMKDIRRSSSVFAYNMNKNNNTVQYEDSNKILDFVYKEISKYYNNIYIME